MKILAIESSCDDTCAAVVENGTRVLSNIISSQTEFHEKYGGVVPEIASRKHINIIEEVIDEALIKSNTRLEEINAFASTAYHGLIGSLLIGLMAGKTLAFRYQKKFIGINHIEGHIYANFINQPDLPIPHLCLTVSGGHTILVLFKDHGQYEVLGQTVDDSAGEAFDKVAQYLQIGFPGGPVIDRLAKTGDPEKYALPRPMLKKDNFLFSFSGLKTAVLNLIKELSEKGQPFKIEDVCASFQAAVVDVLLQKTLKAAKKYQISTLTLSGGVAANSLLRSKFREQAKKQGFNFYYPEIQYCMDNAAMIGTLAYYQYKRGDLSNLDTNAVSNPGKFS